MLPRIIFCTAVFAATLAVVLLALVSPPAHRNLRRNSPPRTRLALSLYVQPSPPSRQPPAVPPPRTAALVFHHPLTAGPEKESPVVGTAQGFIIPAEKFARSAFNLIYFTFRTPEISGSVGVEGRQLREVEREDLGVVGGTGFFAFARGRAVLTRISGRRAGGAAAMYHVKLDLQFPDRSRPTIP